jgi:hypothetical protein
LHRAQAEQGDGRQPLNDAQDAWPAIAAAPWRMATTTMLAAIGPSNPGARNAGVPSQPANTNDNPMAPRKTLTAAQPTPKTR